MVRVFLFLLCAFAAYPATYYVTKSGNDSNDGSQGSPFLTIQKGFDTAQAGDTVNVATGFYSERFASARSGTVGSPITCIGSGATNKGGRIAHQYIEMRGFIFSRQTGESVANDSYLRIAQPNNTIRSNLFLNGIHAFAVDVSFADANPDTITIPGYDLAGAGFVAGTIIYPEPRTNSLTLSNNGPYTVASVSGDVLTLESTNALINQASVHAMINGSRVFALWTEGDSTNVAIERNMFSNLTHRVILAQGANHIIRSNVFAFNGEDTINYAGSNLTVAANLFTTNTVKTFLRKSADVVENWTQERRPNMRFVFNWVQHFDGAIRAHVDTNSCWLFASNVFVDISAHAVAHPGNDQWINNTFLNVAAVPSPTATTPQRHVFDIERADPNPPSPGYGTNLIINNLFYASGYSNYVSNGWYRVVTGTNDTWYAGSNYVSGLSDATKTGWPESSDLNGGSAGFVNINNPLGVDGIPFTSDDGLRLTAASKLRETGRDGFNIGALSTVTGQIARGNRANAGSVRTP